MATKVFYIGSFGPYPYDDSIAITQPDDEGYPGPFPGVLQNALIANGQIQTTHIPTTSNDVIRLSDVIEISEKDNNRSFFLGLF